MQLLLETFPVHPLILLAALEDKIEFLQKGKIAYLILNLLLEHPQLGWRDVGTAGTVSENPFIFTEPFRI